MALPARTLTLPADIELEVEALLDAWDGGDHADPGLRRGCARRLEALRAAWCGEPDRFAPEWIEALRRVGDELRVEERARASPPPAGGRASEPVAAERPTFEPVAARAALKEVFGYTSFRPGQEEIIAAVLAGRDCLGVMPTGAGKSLTYQIPARVLGGTTLVVSPLIALMKDQVDAMGRVGIRAAFVNSSLAPEERRERVERLRRGELELVYAAPEGLEASVGSALAGVRLSLIAVDEAHCISHWGHDFRPAYRNLGGLKGRFGGVPVLGLTATATPEVTADIARQLGMEAPRLVRGSFFRPNLRIAVSKKGDGEGGGRRSVRESLVGLVRARAGQSGIVYCLSRKTVEATAEFLRDQGVHALAYHAGLDAETRTRVQEAFQRDEAEVIVATVAFGMGVDKPNIRYVVHRDMPRSLEGYYQEIGRAGRDGQPSDCILFYSWADVMSFDRFTEGVEDPEVAEWQRRQARAMYRFAESASCRHQGLVGHFGEAMEPCGASCDACTGEDPVEAASHQVIVKRRRAPRSGAGGAATGLVGGRGAPSREAGAIVDGSDARVFEALRALRRRLADERGVPAFYVFSDAVLLEMAVRRPASEADLLDIPGVGAKKLALYGATFLAALRER